MKKTLILTVILIQSMCAQAQLPIYLDDTKPIEQRIEDALCRMTTEEKIAIIHAQSKFSSPGVQRLGIPELWMTDGPHGIRPEVMWDEWDQAGWTNDSCTAFPALTCLAATWNPEMAMLYGKSIGEEARYRGKHVLLGPGVNIYRSPLNGRNFEYMGEDPYLSGRMCVPYIQGVQQNGVAACVKHFALNNQETHRFTTNVIVDDRALHEIYLPAFKSAVQQGGAWAIMGSYNLYRDQQCCHNQYLLNDILKRDWQFDGVVISDWGGTHDTWQSIINGLDMEYGSMTNGLSSGEAMAYDKYFLAQPYLKLIKEGKVGTKELDDKVRRILRLEFRTAMNRQRPYGSLASSRHFAAARQIGAEGIVLLKNDNNVLPIVNARRIAVIGENAIKMMTVGGGSSSLKAQHETSPFDGIRARFQGMAEVVYERGYVGDVTGEYNGVVTGQDLRDSRSEQQLIDDAVALAKTADYVIFIGGLNKSPHQDTEEFDRESMSLPYGQDKVIEALAEVNSQLIVVNISGNAVAMPWVKKVPAIVQDWYLGSEAGTALADVLSGDVNPSGHLPFSFPVRLQDVGAHQIGEYPGTRRDSIEIYDEYYKESIFVGYRWLEKQHVKPLFSFGHGLSYTTFNISNLCADKSEIEENDSLTFSIDVTNTGTRAGAEVVQLYISDLKSSLPRPMKELKGFQKVYLQPGETKTVNIVIDRSALSFYDDRIHAWTAEPGEFLVQVGNSSDNICSKLKFRLKR